MLTHIICRWGFDGCFAAVNYDWSCMKYLSVFLILPLLAACGNPMQVFQNQIGKMGYIVYQNPLEKSGPGTLVGGSPTSLSLVTNPQECFPDSAGTVENPLRIIQDTAIPTLAQTTSFTGSAKVDLLNFLGNSNSLFTVAGGFNIVDTINLQVSNAKIETIDQVVLQNYYNTPENQGGMSQVCKDYLDQVGFIIQALRVDTMTFSFQQKDGGNIDLSGTAIQQIVDVSTDATYSVDQNFNLTFTTPKYIGYQLGKLQKEDAGMDLYRATTTMLNKFIFKSIALFQPSEGPSPASVASTPAVEITSHSVFKP